MTARGGEGAGGGVSRRQVLKGGSAALVGATAGLGTGIEGVAAAPRRPPGDERPNVLLVYLDDLGYGDLGCYGSPTIRTPRLDALAREGTRFTQGYSGAPVCTPSRAALLTGRVPPRSGLTAVLNPGQQQGLPAQERTVAEYLQEAGYFTACVGKWHVGEPADHNPVDHGFDTFFGVNALYTRNTYPTPLWRDKQAVEQLEDDADLATLTRRFTDESLAAIDRAEGRPFFVYLAEVMPHLPLAVEPEFAGTSEAGLYGDVIESLDFHLGRVLDGLAERGLREDTLVIVVSDNGPWFEGNVAGLRGRKFDVFEGGMRVPFIASWPGRSRGRGRVRGRPSPNAVVSVLDLLPTLCALAGVEPDPAITLDGTDISITLLGGSQEPHPPHPPIYYYLGAQLAAVRDGRWKLHVRRAGGEQRFLPELYDVERDPAESYNLALDNPSVVQRLQWLIADLEASVRGAEPPGELRVREIAVAQPMFAGREHVATVTVHRVADPERPEPVEVTVTLDAPEGWSVGTDTRAVEPDSLVTFEVPITPPAGPPVPGLIPTLTANVTSETLSVSGAPTASAFAVPHADETVLALDAGLAASPLLASYQALTPETAWDPARGHGWVGAPPQARDRGAPDPLRRDMVTDPGPAVLRLQLPPGPRLVWILRGDHDFATTGIVVEADGQPVVSSGPSVDADEYWWEQFSVDAGPDGRTVDLQIRNDAAAFWKVLALVVE